MQKLNNSPALMENVVLEHIGNACELLAAIHSAAFSPQSVDSFGNLCRRCEANLDALRIAGDTAIGLAEVAVPDDSQVASVVSLLMADCANERCESSEKWVDLFHHEVPEIRQSAWWGLRLAGSRHVEPHLRALFGKPKWDFASAAALDILAFHRLPVQVELGALPDEEGDEIAWLLAEAGGRIPGAWTLTHLQQFLGHSSQRVREAALRASARSGLLGLREVCRQAASLLKSSEAISFLGVVGSREDLQLLQSAVNTPAVAESALAGLGRLGFSGSIPFLLEAMESPALAELAAGAFWRITGQKVERGPAPEPPPGLTEDELDFWEPQPPIDQVRTREWWIANALRFDSAKRYQVGFNVTDDPLGPVFDQLPLGIRYDVFLRERALTSGTPDWELETWTWKQRNPASM